MHTRTLSISVSILIISVNVGKTSLWIFLTSMWMSSTLGLKVPTSVHVICLGSRITMDFCIYQYRELFYNRSNGLFPPSFLIQSFHLTLSDSFIFLLNLMRHNMQLLSSPILFMWGLNGRVNIIF